MVYGGGYLLPSSLPPARIPVPLPPWVYGTLAVLSGLGLSVYGTLAVLVGRHPVYIRHPGGVCLELPFYPAVEGHLASTGQGVPGSSENSSQLK